jgi:hypothetical protein
MYAVSGTWSASLEVTQEQRVCSRRYANSDNLDLFIWDYSTLGWEFDCRVVQSLEMEIQQWGWFPTDPHLTSYVVTWHSGRLESLWWIKQPKKADLD